ncbi:MAG TPA: hypothetical protein VNJ54_20050 [Plantibacter sp.]|uniref:lipopolysaccharide biosynthesis protein n=1 Tax=unclassified Plantibacter TaxID=2624265 RepID=UPI002CD6C5D9|nr:hypothetical protein [Plantibacter sp.]
MIHLAWSIVERVLPRMASALVMLVLAAVLTPEIVGVYAWMVLSLTLVQTVGDTAARQTAVIHAGTIAGARFVWRFRVATTLAGGAALAIVVLMLLLTQDEPMRWQVVALLPFVLVPGCSALGLDALVSLQLAGRWRDIASAQAVSSLASLCCSIPTLLLTQSLLASALQATLAELGFALLNRRRAARLLRDTTETVIPAPVAPGAPADGEPNHVAPVRSAARDYLHTAVFALLGWGQGQTDRLSIGTLAGTAQLGQYSFAMSLSRSIGDAAAVAAVNVVRPVLAEAARTGRRSEAARIAEGSLRRSIPLAALAAVVTTAAVQLGVAPFLGASWDPALALVPILSLAVVPSVVAWTITAILQADDGMQWASWIKAIGVVLSVPIGIVALTDLQFAAWLVSGRELLIMGLLLLAARRQAPWRGALGATVVVLGGAAVWWAVGAW